MPLYEYECDNCGHKFEKIHSMHDQPIQICPNCGANQVRKLFHPAGIIFKGSGWYINDSRKASSGSPSSASSQSESKTETKSDSKGDTKSDSQGDSKRDSKSESKGDSKSESKTESQPAAKPGTDSKSKT